MVNAKQSVFHHISVTSIEWRTAWAQGSGTDSCALISPLLPMGDHAVLIVAFHIIRRGWLVSRGGRASWIEWINSQRHKLT
jgi:hypothetical protein